ncbi:pullulanase [Anaerobranca californiensis DSM 14826]|uniref:pullulanase n=1 Tax=Anaerobranca californiensis DSM 14826 TaxID=1120989 RepID=A0A1M6MM44_9FIRM|nr:type I pullulanase [Anaerobranca californiensis]SHJ84450.1 pullulanase [Anaerobranca californiensis DSM 14826]
MFKLRKLTLFVLLLFIMAFLAGCGGKDVTQPPPQEEEEDLSKYYPGPPPLPDFEVKTTLIINYHRYEGDYRPWDLWVWADGKDGKAYQFTELTDYGVRATIYFPEEYDRLGFIVRRGNWSAKDVDRDRFVDVVDGKAEIWLLQSDPNIYFSQDEVNKNPRIVSAYMDGKDEIIVSLTHQHKLTDGDNGFVIKGENKEYNVKKVEIVGSGSSGNVLKLTLEKELDITANYTIESPDYTGNYVIKRRVLDLPEFYYAGDDLGNTYTKNSTKFRVWAPTALNVKVRIYNTADAKEGKDYDMKKDVNGTWFLEIKGDLKNKYYTYIVDHGYIVNEAVDPYVRAVSLNSTKGMIVDLKETNPKGWDSLKKPEFKNYTDAIIYEMHVRDYSIYPQSGNKYKGKYLGLIEKGTTGPGGVKTGLDHLVELGITHIHLLPTYDFASIDDSRDDQYNWGYDPRLYNVPQGTYSTNAADGLTRIREYKEMVMGLNQAGIRVIKDVVYNHTYTVGDSPFDLIVPKYFYRTDDKGNYTNGSGCGNEIASERPMVRKFIVDSVKYWATEYKIDGFRFDLMALHDVDTMLAVQQALHQIDPSIIIYGEPWQAGGSPLPANLQFTKGKQRGTRIAVFNDHIRNAIKGDNDGATKGYAQGMVNQRDNVIKGIMGAIDDFAQEPTESIVYVTCHDNLTLWDKIEKSNPNDSVEDRIRMNLLSNAIVLTSQGVPFLHGGVEMMRTKYGDHNSYKSPDHINQIEWSRKHTYYEEFLYHQGLIRLRREHPAFRMPTAEMVRKHMEILDSPDGSIMFHLKDNANGDPWKDIVVIYNPNGHDITVNLPKGGTWDIVVKDKKAGVDTLETINGSSVKVPRISMMVLYQN